MGPNMAKLTESVRLMGRVIVILIIRRLSAVVAAMKVGDIMWVDAARSQRICSRDAVMHVVLEKCVSHRSLGWWLHVMIAVLPAYSVSFEAQCFRI